MSEAIYNHNKAKAELYRKVFGTPEGIGVLTDMLNDLDYFNLIEPDDQAGCERRNYATRLLFKLGITTGENRQRVVMALMGVMPPEPKKEEIEDYGR